MKKPATLRAHLTETVPQLGKHPDKLHLFIDKGAIATKPGASLSFEYRYTLNLIVTDYTESADTLIVPLLVWLSTNQPDLIADPDRRYKAIAFEADIIDHETVDLSLTLELSERIVVRAVIGGWECEHFDEPPLPDLGGTSGWESYMNGELIASGNA